MTSERFSWSVELPERARSGFGQRKPLATVTMSGPEGDELLHVPVALARKISSKTDSGELAASSRAEFKAQVGELARACAFDRIVGLLDKRDYSAHEAREKLRLEGYAASSADSAVARAQELRFIDDARFADVFIRSKAAQGWGRARIERELAGRGIDPHDVAGWPADYLSSEDELERAYELCRRRPLKGRNDYDRLMRYLCSRGYGASLASSAVRRVLEEAGESG